MKEYQRYLTPGFTPFDPVGLARATEEIVCDGGRRRYTDIYAVGVYGGIATGYACGCCLRCIYCWVNWSRDFPEKYGRFYTPQEVVQQLQKIARKKRVRRARISGCEPTLGKEHLLNVLSLVEKTDIELFILETNGILFGVDEDYVRRVARAGKVHVRVSLKAGTPEGFTRRTGAQKDSFELPFQAIRFLLKHGASFHVAAMSADERFVAEKERDALLRKLHAIDPSLCEHLEEEVVDPYETTLARLRHAGYKLTQ